MSYYVEMLDGVNQVSEAHRCVGDGDACETPAVCEDHGDCVAGPDNPVYVWEAGGLTFVACEKVLAAKTYAQLVER